MVFRKLTLLLVTVLIFICLSAQRSYALSDFTTTLHSTYSVAESGITHVNQTFNLKNNFSTIYATQYALEVSSNHIDNIVVESNGVALTPSVLTHANQTSISFPFPDKVVGRDQIREFSVSYDTADLSIITGNIIEIHVPKLANIDEFTQYTVTVDVDSKYGLPALTTPASYSTSQQNGRELITFTNSGQSDGISILFGREQTARAELTYHLENPKSNRGIMEIALPPDTDYQRISYESIDPSPITVRQDPDGNWIASYQLEAGERLNVKAIADIRLFLIPKDVDSTVLHVPGAEYLSAQPYWPVNDPDIQALAKKLKTPKAIFDFVVKTLRYDYSRLEGSAQRLGAIGALKNPASSVCTEFTDLFVTLARAAGIPSREINGYAFSQNNTLRPLNLVQDVLHAWPQYWDVQTSQWISVDPTWDNTTGGIDYFNHIDFNHISFVIHGLSSETPYSAGMYKFIGQDTKDVSVTFGAPIQTQPDHFTVRTNSSARSLLTSFSPYSLIIRNDSLHAVYNSPYVVALQSIGDQTQMSSGVISLPPLSEKQVPVQLPGSKLFSGRTITISTTIGSKTSTDQINVESFIVLHLQLIALTVFVGSCAILIAFITWRLLVPRRKRSGPLRR